MLEYLLDIAVMLTAIISSVIAVVVINRHPDIVDLELFGPAEIEDEPKAMLPYPCLDFERIFERTKNEQKRLQLMLKNIGKTLVFEGIRPGQKSELMPEYLPLELKPSEQSVEILDEYPSGTTLTIFLFPQTDSEIENEEKYYYDFLIKFQDIEGNYYRQRVSGLWEEMPVIDLPKKLTKIST